MPEFWRSIPNQAKSLEHFMAIFIDLWPCLFTTKLSYTQLFKWGHSNDHRWKKEMNSVSIIKTANYIPLKNKIISLLSLRLTKIIQLEIISNNGWSFENWSIIMSTFTERKRNVFLRNKKDMKLFYDPDVRRKLHCDRN